MRRIGWMLLALLAIGVVEAKEFKIGVVSLERIIREAPQTSAIKNRLKKEFKPREDAMDQEQKVLKEALEGFKRDRSVMSATDLKAAEGKLNKKQRDFLYKRQTFREDFMRAQNTEMEHLLKAVKAEIQSIAESRHYDIVLQEESVPFVSASLDITAAVIDALKKQDHH